MIEKEETNLPDLYGSFLLEKVIGSHVAPNLLNYSLQNVIQMDDVNVFILDKNGFFPRRSAQPDKKWFSEERKT